MIATAPAIIVIPVRTALVFRSTKKAFRSIDRLMPLTAAACVQLVGAAAKRSSREPMFGSKL